MSNDPSQQEGLEAQPSTNGSNNQTTSSQQNGEPSNSTQSGQTDGEVSQVNGQNGSHNGGSSKVTNNETPEEMRQELEALRKELATQLQKKQSIDRQLVSHESAIYAFETSYLSVDLSAGPTNATFGNIVKGYDSYLKSGAAAAEAARKKQSSSSTRGHGGLGPGYATGIVGPGGSILQPVLDEDRLFSRSSGTYLDSLQLRERDQQHLMGLAASAGGNTGNSAGSDVEELDDADLNDGNESTAAPSTGANTPQAVTPSSAPLSASLSRDKDANSQRDPKRQKKR